MITDTKESAPYPVSGKATMPPVARTAADVRRAARAVLDAPGRGQGSPRLILALSLTLALALSLFPVLAVDCLYMAGVIFFDGFPAWFEPALNSLAYLSLVLLGVPLFTSVFRLSVLLTNAAHETGCAGDSISVRELFYPFSSGRAYVRTLRVGGEALLWLLLIVGSPVVAGVLAEEAAYAIFPPHAPDTVFHLMTVLGIVIGILPAILFLWLSGIRAGYGYTVFSHPEASLAACGRRYRALSRRPSAVMRLRVSFAGWFFLSLLCVCVPFLFHTIPYEMLAFAEYARTLTTKN